MGKRELALRPGENNFVIASPTVVSVAAFAINEDVIATVSKDAVISPTCVDLVCVVISDNEVVAISGCNVLHGPGHDGRPNLIAATESSLVY